MSTDLYWYSPYTCVYEDNALRLLKFSDGDENLLILPPQSGQHSCIADLDENHSVVQCATEHTALAVYAIEWKSCTLFRINEGVEDLLAQVATCVEHIGGRTHLVGMSQGGWLSTIYTALNPDQILSLSVAGAPIDTEQGDSALRKIIDMPLSVYYSHVLISGGMMRGKAVYNAIKTLCPRTYLYHRYLSPNRPHDKIFAWRESGQNLAGRWFLWAIENIFKKNRLGKNELYIGKRHVDLRNIRCPVNIVTGTEDDIAPPDQSLVLTQYTVTPPRCYTTEADHEGVFTDTDSITRAWRPLLTSLAA